MNMQISTIENAMAQAGVSNTWNEILSMLHKEKPMSTPVRRVMVALANCEEIKEVTHELSLERRCKPTEQVAHMYDQKMHEILDYLKIKDMTIKQLSQVTGLSIKKTAYLMQLLSRRNRTRSYKAEGIDHYWRLFDDGNHKDVAIKIKATMRKDAAERGEKYYHGTAHYKCGNTLRLTSSGDCIECSKTRDKNRNGTKLKEM